MRILLALALISGTAIAGRGAESCNPRDLLGAYGLQLTGETTISGLEKPAVSLGRLVFDDDGGVSGTASVKFAGYLLGNPVTGTYEAHRDCTVSWSLQDDSGGYQHFSGVATSDALRVSFRQSDPGGAQNGLLVRTAADGCKAADLRKSYSFTISGSLVPMTDGGASGTVAAEGAMEADANHNFHLLVKGDVPYTTDVAITVESDCTVELVSTLPFEGGAPAPVNLRGILADAGKEILAIQTDPGAIVSARFTARSGFLSQ